MVIIFHQSFMSWRWLAPFFPANFPAKTPASPFLDLSSDASCCPHQRRGNYSEMKVREDGNNGLKLERACSIFSNDLLSGPTFPTLVSARPASVNFPAISSSFECPLSRQHWCFPSGSSSVPAMGFFFPCFLWYLLFMTLCDNNERGLHCSSGLSLTVLDCMLGVQRLGFESSWQLWQKLGKKNFWEIGRLDYRNEASLWKHKKIKMLFKSQKSTPTLTRSRTQDAQHASKRGPIQAT